MHAFFQKKIIFKCYLDEAAAPSPAQGRTMEMCSSDDNVQHWYTITDINQKSTNYEPQLRRHRQRRPPSPPWGRTTKMRSSDDDDGQHWYATPDINQKLANYAPQLRRHRRRRRERRIAAFVSWCGVTSISLVVVA